MLDTGFLNGVNMFFLFQCDVFTSIDFRKNLKEKEKKEYRIFEYFE